MTEPTGGQVSSEGIATPPAGEEETRVALHTGFELDAETVSLVSGNAWARVILIAGPEGAGKTTLLTSLYESFQHDRFAGYGFAGSLTLAAFERLAHQSRVVSQRVTAETERTPPGDRRRYLHLRLKSPTSRELREIVFTDLAGEQFRLVCDSEEECRSLLVAKRADHVTLLIDGQKMIDSELRAGAQSEARRLIRSLADAAMIGKHTLLEVVFSKWDLLASGANKEALAYCGKTEDVLRTAFQDRLGGLRVLRIAARPANATVPFAYGLNDLLQLWVEESLVLSKLATVDEPPPAPESEFERFGTR